MSSAAQGYETTIGLLITSNSGMTLCSGLLATRLRRG